MTVDSAVVDAIVELAENTPLDITARARDADDGDGVDATIFIDHIEANTAGGVADPRDATRVCVGAPPLMAVDTDTDGHLDTFMDVDPGTPVCFDIIARMNDSIMPTDRPQLFRALVDVIAPVEDGFLAANGVTKGIMQLIDLPRASELYAAMGPAPAISGGSVANTIGGLSGLGARTGFHTLDRYRYNRAVLRRPPDADVVVGVDLDGFLWAARRGATGA